MKTKHKGPPEEIDSSQTTMVNVLSLRCQTSAAVVCTSLLLASVGFAQQQSVQTTAQLSGRIDAQLATMQKESAQSEPANGLTEELEEFLEKSVMIFGERRQWVTDKLRQLQESIDRWRAAAPANSVEAIKAMAQAEDIWAEIKAQYPREALQVLPPLWSCSMHQDLMLSSPDSCPICGMPLEPIYVTQPVLTQGPIIRAEITAKEPLVVRQKADLRIRLRFNKDGRSVSLDDLEEAQTRKIHLLISDMSETDYHHEHPQPVGDGEYAFSFTPSRPDTYRVWADLRPALTHIQQYSIADIPSRTPRQGQPPGIESENRHVEIEGWKFDLTFEKSVIHEKETVAGKLRVTDPDGKPCDKLEVVMGAFGHFVGFCEDFSTVLHIHPVGPPLATPDSLGGPELPFYFRSNRPEIIRLFGQVKIQGRDFFPRFVIKVHPLQHLPRL